MTETKPEQSEVEAASQKKKWPLVIGLLALCVLIAVVPLFLNGESEFEGADGEAEELIEEIAPEYEPWAEPFFEPPGGETESLLFCIQAALGGIVLGYGFGYYYSRKKFQPV